MNTTSSSRQLAHQPEQPVEEVVFAGQVDDDELYAYYRVADVFLCLSEHEGFCVPLQEAMHFNLPVIAYDAGAVRETLHGGGLLLRDKQPDLVAELLDRVTHGGPLRRAVLASQARAIAGIRATDFGAMLAERLGPAWCREVLRTRGIILATETDGDGLSRTNE